MHSEFDRIRVGTLDDARDAAKAAATIIPIPASSIYDGNDVDQWNRRAHNFLTGIALHAAYTLQDVDKIIAEIEMLPEDAIRSMFKRIQYTKHDPELLCGWLNDHNEPTAVHPIVFRSMTTMLRRPTNEFGSVLSTVKMYFWKAQQPDH